MSEGEQFSLSDLNDCLNTLMEPTLLKDLESKRFDAVSFASSILGFDDLKSSVVIDD